MSEGNAGKAPDPMVDVRDNPTARQYEALACDTVVGSIKYWPHGHRVVFGHTTVDSAYRGKGVAGRLVQMALDDVSTKKQTLTNYCPFVADYIADHPWYRNLIDSQHPGPAAVPNRPSRSGSSGAHP
jgi:hypothetical protein